MKKFRISILALAVAPTIEETCTVSEREGSSRQSFIHFLPLLTAGQK